MKEFFPECYECASSSVVGADVNPGDDDDVKYYCYECAVDLVYLTPTDGTIEERVDSIQIYLNSSLDRKRGEPSVNDLEARITALEDTERDLRIGSKRAVLPKEIEGRLTALENYVNTHLPSPEPLPAEQHPDLKGTCPKCGV